MTRLVTHSLQRHIKVPLALLVAGALAGCVVGPDYKTVSPAQVAPGIIAASSGATSTAVGDDWWTGFHDPALNALVQAALSHSPDIESADASIRQARATVAQVASARDPQVNANGQVSRDKLSVDGEEFANIPFANPQTAFTDYRGGLDASWEIDLFGHTARSVESAKAHAGAVEAQRADAALRVSAETARNVLDYRHLQRRIANARAMLSDQQALLKLVQLQRDAGVASDIDVKQAEIGVRSAEATLPPLDATVQSCIAALIPLTGLSQHDIAGQLAHVSDQPVLPEAAEFAVSSTVLERRPDVRLAERQLASATADIGVAKADQYPRFTLVGDAGWDSIHPGQFGQQASRYWNFGPQISVPLLNGNRIQSAIDQSEASRDVALANYRKAVLAALADTESALLRCRGDHGRLEKLENSVQLQVQLVALTKQRVEAGEAPELDWLNAQIQRAALDDQQLAMRQALAEDLVLLYKAMGGSPVY